MQYYIIKYWKQYFIPKMFWDNFLIKLPKNKD